MKQKIHPQYNEDIKATCVCGKTFTAGSTESVLEVEVCSACHPFYTGKQKFVGVAGRVDKFRERVKAAEAKAKKKSAGKKPTGKKEDNETTIKLG